MDFQNLKENHKRLIDYLERHNYSSTYIAHIRKNIDWILKNNNSNWISYIDVYNTKVSNFDSKSYKRHQRNMINIIALFDSYNIFPNRQRTKGLFPRDSYSKLSNEFKTLVDLYANHERNRGLKEHTIYGKISSTSSFLYHIQKRGKLVLNDITEKDVLSFFIDTNSKIIICGNYKRQISYAFKSNFNWKDDERSRILSYFPCIRPKRKNIQYFTADEINAIHKTLNSNNILTFREKAIGCLLFFTGIRACDIANLKLSSIDWQKEEIRFAQQKTGKCITLPLSTIIGNSIFDYITKERPSVESDYLFLSEPYPHRPLQNRSIGTISNKIYAAANIRTNKGDRRGTHLFRFNVASTLLQNGISRPVISQTLGHSNPNSLDAYLYTDFEHLKECALSIEAFPISEEVFSI